ncbi:DNA polymerase III subunit beta [Candidatus Calescamantes bacterium]|nr:DNA polymerase III subunit beta [Candidatus Calescamantes bacterium]
MRVKCERDQILKGISFCQGVISTRTTLPILSYVLMKAEKNTLSLYATDLEVGVETRINAEIVEEGSITLPGKKMLELIREFPSGIITLSSENNLVTIRNENIWIKMISLPQEEFPAFPEVKGREIKVNGKILKKMIKKTSFSVSHEETRYMLNGIYTTVFEKLISMVSTDGRRLSLITQELENVVPTEVEAILPLKACEQLTKIMEDDEVLIVWGDKQIKFTQPGVSLVTRIIEGEFPDYKSVIPKSFKGEGHIDKTKFQESIRRAYILTKEKALSVRLSLQEGKMKITTRVPDQGESNEEMEIEYSGEAMDIAFDPEYLLDVLRVLDCEKIFFGVNGPEDPALIKPINGESYIYVVMPMKI